MRVIISSVAALCVLLPSVGVSADAEASIKKTQFAYGVNAGDWSLTQYRVNPTTGALQQNGHLPTSKFPAAAAVHPSKRFLLTAVKTGAEVFVHRIDASTGRLTEIPQSPFKAGATSPYSISIHPSGRFVYVAARWGGVVAFSMDQESGVLTLVPGSPFAAEKRTRSLQVHPSGRFVYATNAHSNSISAYRVNEKTGVLTQLPGSPFSTGAEMVVDVKEMKLYEAPPESGGSPYRVEIHPSGRFIFVTNWMGLNLSVFRVDTDTGVITPVKGSPFNVGDGGRPYAVTVHPSGRFVYLSSWDNHLLWGFQFNEDSGQIAVLPDAPYVFESWGMIAIDFNASGTNAYITSLGNNSIAQFSVDVQSGKLALKSMMRTRFQPFDFALHEAEPVEVEQSTSFVTETEKNQLQVLRAENLNASTAPQSQHDSQGLADEEGLATAAEPRGRFIYRALKRTDKPKESGIAVYRVDQKNNALTLLPERTVKLGFIPTDLVVDKSGRFLYAVNPTFDSLGVFSIDSNSGALSLPDSPVPKTGKKPVAVALDPVNRFSFVANSADNTVSVFTHDRIKSAAMYHINKTGSVFPVGDTPVALTVDPTGKFLVVANQNSNNLSVFNVHFHGGQLTTVEGSPFTSGKKPVSVAIHPSAKFVYAINADGGDVSSYRLDSETGVLHALKLRVDAGKLPQTITLSSEGGFAYVQNKGVNALRKYRVDTVSGKLTYLGEVGVGLNITAVR